MKKLATIKMRGKTVKVDLGMAEGKEPVKAILIAQAIGAAIDSGDIEVEITDLHDNVVKMNGDSHG